MKPVRTVEQLERALRSADLEPLAPVRLSDIRARGRRRRRARVAGAVGATAAAVVAASLGVATLTGAAGDRAHDVPPTTASDTAPRELSAIARRALAEVPGAVQVSSWQVVVPAPSGAAPDRAGELRVPLDAVDAGPVDIGTRHYTGVTSFDRSAFPAWLWDGIADHERDVLGEGQTGYPVGSTDLGVVVDDGPLRLVCMRRPAEWGAGTGGQPGCYPAMLSGDDQDLLFEWGLGTDDFLQEGEDLELFSTDDYATGSPREVWLGGTHGTEVAAVDLVATDGTTVAATVASGTLVPGHTMFWGTPDGTLARVVTRAADGRVLEDHEVEPCTDPVDCEVR